MSRLCIFTIVLDGMPFIERHLLIFQQLSIPWRWIVVEGASGNTADTAWCQKQKPRLSADGTHEYLQSIEDERVTHIFRKHWPNKTVMCNAALSVLSDPCVLFQIDADELWTAAQLTTVVRLFTERPQLSSIMFPCRYFVGPGLILRGENCYGDHPYEWLRAWRFAPGTRFISHEPPVIEGEDIARRMSKAESRSLVGPFEHYSYYTLEQVTYKSSFYGYSGLVEQWEKLQTYKHFPVPLNRFFPFVLDNRSIVTKCPTPIH